MDSQRTPEAILDDLGALEPPIDLDRLTSLLRELAATLEGRDDLTIAKYREAAIRQLKPKVSSRAKLVDAAFAVLRPGRLGSTQGGTLELETPEPWPEAVPGVALLDEIAAALRQYVVLVPPAIDAIALWDLHTHSYETSVISPRLAIVSPTKRCAKTLLLEILEHLVPRPLNVSNVTAAAVFRGVQKYRPTLLIDEADTFLRDKDELRGILNSGQRHNGRVVRLVGKQHEVQTFSTFAPVAIAMIGRLPDTLADRSIQIMMRRKRRDERVERFRPDRAGDLEELRSKAARWSLDHSQELGGADPAVPASLHDREQDNWRPLLAIADAAGGDWPDRARAAALALSTSAAPDSQDDASTLLLADLREIFDTEDALALFTDDLVQKLRERDERPWAEWRNDKPLTGRQMAFLLRPFEVRPAQVRIGPRSSKGYRREALEDAFSRYLPPPDPKHPKQTNGIKDLRPSSIRNTETPVSDRKAPKAPASTGVVSDVSDREGDLGAEEAPGASAGHRSKRKSDEVNV